MGQSLVFVSMPPTAIEGEETNQDPQTQLPREGGSPELLLF